MKNLKTTTIFLLLLVVLGQSRLVQAQISTDELAGQANPITTAVPFLIIAPDSRAGAMGDVGAATAPDVNSQHWNPAKYAFIDNDMGVSLSYTPWLRNLIDDINLAYLSGYKRLDRDQVIGMSLLYFSLGNITFTNIQGQYNGEFNPNEFAIDASYARKFSRNFSSAIALRYIYSNLTGGAYVGDTESHPGHAVAADLSVFYTRDVEVAERNSDLAFGLNISNIGSKISYTDEAQQNFIPINMRLGAALTMELDEYNSIMFTADANKLLVPTPPQQVGDTLYGKDPANISIASGVFNSFSDAPGGFKEEMHEIAYSVGLEYWYNKQFAVRGGYFYEHENKGNRKYFTFGVGLKLNVFGLDFAYLVPAQGRNHPLANTLRFTLLFDFEGFRNQQEGEQPTSWLQGRNFY